MIYKDLDPFIGADKYAIAGRRAEEQMAHYLKRFFGNSPEVDALNYLRIELGGEVAQLDHLVLHPFGLTIVESKSVAGGVQIKEDGQWIRWFNKQPQGMRSPVIQAKMQSMLLREMLAKTVKQKGFFDSVELDVLVAISDSGTIQCPSSGPIPDVCKADQIPERIQKKIQVRHSFAPPILSQDHRRVIAEFLCAIHRPLADSRTTEVQRETAEASKVKLCAPREPAALPDHLAPRSCKHCGGVALEVHHGRYGYYFACKTCQKNTNIKFACPACGAEGRIRKQAKDFFAECKSCDVSALFYSNP